MGTPRAWRGAGRQLPVVLALSAALATLMQPALALASDSAANVHEAAAGAAGPSAFPILPAALLAQSDDAWIGRLEDAAAPGDLPAPATGAPPAPGGPELVLANRWLEQRLVLGDGGTLALQAFQALDGAGQPSRRGEPAPAPAATASVPNVPEGTSEARCPGGQVPECRAATASVPDMPEGTSEGAGELHLEYIDAWGQAHDESALHYLGYAVAREPGGALRLDVRLEDAATGLLATRTYRLWPNAPAIERTTVLENNGLFPLQLRRLDALTLQLAPARPELGWLAMTASPDLGFTTQPLSVDAPLQIQVPAGSGVPEDTIPAFVVAQPGSGGVFGGLAWSSNYQIRLRRLPDAGALVQAGEVVSGQWLLPGEQYAAPPAFAGVFQGELDDASRALQAYLQARYGSRPAAPFPSPPVTWNSWFAYDRNVDEQQLMAEAEAAAALGVEVFYVDHGWERAIGDWRARPDRFTDGSLLRLSQRVHALGMRFGAWIAFGVADPDSPVAQLHPEWLATSLDPSAPKPIDGARVLCLAPAHDWALAELDRAVREYQLDWLKLDQAMIGSCAPAGASAATVAESIRKNTLAFYDIIRTLRERFPALVIENCYDGGGYLDFALYGLTDYAWLTDAAGNPGFAPSMLQAAFSGASRAMPASYLTMWLAHPDLRTPGALEYRALSTMGGAWGLSLRLTELSATQQAEIAALVRRYKQLRPYIARGRLYHLSEPSDSGWFAVAYVLPGGEDAAVLVIRNDDEAAAPQLRRLSLPGLDPAATYDVTWDGGSGKAASLTRPLQGEALVSPDGGLPVTLGGQEGAIVYLHRR